jgi:hypothetical protein
LLLRIFKSFHYAYAMLKDLFILDQYKNDNGLYGNDESYEKTQNIEIWWAKRVVDVNLKFTVLFSLKIILEKSTFLGGLQNLKWA